MPVTSHRRLLAVTAALFLSIQLLFSIWLEYVPLHEVERIADDGYWGKGEGAKDDKRIEIFNVNIAEEKIKRLKELLTLEVSVPPLDDCLISLARHEFLRNLSNVMASFNWQMHQHFFNTFKQYRTEIEGLRIHFLRTSLPKDPSKDTVPLLLLHGFPGSYWDFYKVIPILTNPARFGFDFGAKRPLRFDVIIPSLPGFVFSDKPFKTGFATVDMARIMAKLMNRLNVHWYFVHGSELLGSEVAATMSALYPTSVRGVHLSNPIIHPQFSSQVRMKYLLESFLGFETGDSSKTLNFLEDRTRIAPDSDVVGEALLSSLLGTSSYLASVWSGFSTQDNSVLLNQLFTLDEIATISYLYYLTETTPHALRIMRTFFYDDLPKQRLQVRVPCGILVSPQTPWSSSRSISRHRFLNITSFTRTSEGGVFLHLQDPNAFAADVFRFIELVLM